MRYNNYHKHTHYSNLRTLDCIVKPIDYIKRAKELGHTTYFTTEHGWGGNVWEAYTLCKENDLKMIFGAEAYYVDNRFEKDRSNYHIVLIAKNKSGFLDINRIISEANKSGFYYKPRIDKELLLSLNSNNVFITTACVAGRIFKTDNYEEEFLIPVYNHFKNNFFLEVQSHKQQAKYNKQILDLHKKYNISLIHGNDSHYINKKDSKYRDMFLQAKGIFYEDESSFILDYPDSDEIIKRYKEQGILNDNKIQQSLENTLIFDECEDLNFDKEIKIPKIHKNKDSNKLLKEIIAKEWKNERENIPKKEWSKYKKAITEEIDIVQKTNMEDYFILDYEIVKKAVNEYKGVLTKTGRGCFTKDALIITKDGLKTLDKVVKEDEVISDDGMWHKVEDTFKYDIEEDMLEFQYQCQGSSYKKYKNICTLDHKILVNRNNTCQYIKAKNLKVGDLLCCPKIKNDNKEIVYDLSEYITECCTYDENYIYEKIPVNEEYKYSPKWLDRNNIVNHNFAKKISDGFRSKNPKTIKNIEKILSNTPFKTIDDYQRYQNKRGFVIYKIPRYIKFDYMWNAFIGLMYADGWTNKKYGLGLAINNTTKNGFNKYVFYKIAERLNLNVVVNKSKNRNLVQLSIISHTLNNLFRKEFFHSIKGNTKYFNSDLLEQNNKKLKFLYYGLFKADGSIDYKNNKMSFDNTSLSILNAFKVISNKLGYDPFALDLRFAYVDKRGYNNQESYKLRKPINRKQNKIIKDNKYWYLPITKIEIRKNMKTEVYDLHIKDNHSYMINNVIVHNSAPSFYVNKLLGFTNIDRVSAPITLYPTRFMSTTRILQTKSLPDIDLNWSDIQPVVKASKDILGEDGVYFMIAYKPLQDSSAFRLWCKAKGMNISEYNDIAKNLEEYIEDERWKDLIEESKIFRGVIESVAPSPCSFLLLDKPISEEIGLIKVGNEICCCLDGYNCDQYKYLKNDYLTVSVWTIISEVYKMIGKPIDTIKELEKKVDDKVWKLYELGLTATLNQADSNYATPLIKRYAPKSIAEISAWVASIRPGFASLMDNFLHRKPYSTGVNELDELLEDSYHYMMYQESIMKYLVWLGVPEDETYGIIKKIAKKKFKEKELEELKSKLLKGWIKNVSKEEGFNETWQVVNDASKYSFNASHSLSVGIDSLYGAYLKANYPLEYYTVVLNMYKDDSDETGKIASELDYFNIKILPPRFRYSKAEYMCDKEQNAIYKGVASIKFLNETVANELYNLRDNEYNSFLDLLIDMKNKTGINSKQLEILIKLDYFLEFGKSQKLLTIVDLYNNVYVKKQIKKADLDKLNLTEELMNKHSNKITEKMFKDINMDGLIKELINTIENKSISIQEKIQTELEMLGYIKTVIPKAGQHFYIVTEIKTYKDKNKPYMQLYRIKNGEMVKAKVKKADVYKQKPFEVYNLIKATEIKEEFKKKKVDDKWINTDEKQLVINDWLIL